MASATAARNPAGGWSLRLVPDPYASVERFIDLVGRCHELGFTDVVVNHPRPSGVFQGDPAMFEQAVRQTLAVFAEDGQ
ncbi:hypothetical protein AB0M79_30700 [Polymorphospora sp. NPDC051019]|uniref:hypothetical protein n=1 Tax=Polymorphospora sp. NPDC051019 TaxID=3155725 RepID=UPI00343A96BB